jgi:hypothetical protein
MAVSEKQRNQSVLTELSDFTPFLADGKLVPAIISITEGASSFRI